jgi:DNA recombination protein RmuC
VSVIEIAALSLLLGLLVGALAVGLRARAHGARTARLELEGAALSARLGERDGQLARLHAELRRRDEESALRAQELRAEASRRAAAEATLTSERQSAGEKLVLLEQARAALGDAFKALSAEALSTSAASFLELARTHLERWQEGARGDLERREQAIGALLGPVRESLARVDARIGEIEKTREGAYGALNEQLRALAETQNVLRTEAASLVKALRAPQVRGRWGEVQLRRVVELAGMVQHCDFEEQVTVAGEDGRLRPDLVVRLPGGKSVVVDAKAPLAAYLDALEAPDEATREARLADHARQVRAHVDALSRKAYWEQLRPTPEFVVLFLPGETFYAAALEQDPALLEAGAGQNVLIATPTTLIALLKTVAYGWRQEVVAENARAVANLGRELHKRLADVAGHVSRVGRSLGGAVEAYNQAVGSLESRVLVSARRFAELEVTGPERIEVVPEVEQAPRQLHAPELVPLSAPGGDELAAVAGGRGRRPGQG